MKLRVLALFVATVVLAPRLHGAPVVGYGTTTAAHDAFALWYLSEYTDHELKSYVLLKMDSISRSFPDLHFAVNINLEKSQMLKDFFGSNSDAFPNTADFEFSLNNISFGFGAFSINLGIPLAQTALALANGGFSEYAHNLPAPFVGYLDAALLGDCAIFAQDDAAYESSNARYYCLRDILSLHGNLSFDDAFDLDYSYRDFALRGGALGYSTFYSESAGKNLKDFSVALDYFQERKELYLKADLGPFLRYVKKNLVPDFFLIPESLGFSANLDLTTKESLAMQDEGFWQQFDFGPALGMGDIRLQLKETYLTLPGITQVHGMLWNRRLYVESVFFPATMRFGSAAFGVNWMWRMFTKDWQTADQAIDFFGSDWPNFLGSSISCNSADGNGFGYAQGGGALALYPVDVQYILKTGKHAVGASAKIGFGSAYGYPGTKSEAKFLMQVGANMYF
jgi:hypothetical protein